MNTLIYYIKEFIYNFISTVVYWFKEWLFIDNFFNLKINWLIGNDLL